jgi:peptidylprolyl isomerase
MENEYMRMLCRAVFALVCICGVTNFSSSSLNAEEASQPVEKKKELTKEELFSKENVKKLSESLGHFIYKSLDNPLMKLDCDAVSKGLQDAKAGKPAPMTEQEYEESLQKIQEIAFEEMSKSNLQEADQFLEKNKKKTGMQLLEDGKIQFEIVQPGTGDEVVTDASSVLMHYDGSYLNGKSFSSSREAPEPITIILSQTIPGFKKGLIGMKTGEKRRLYIHPDLGYGTCGQLLPNALLVFDVEVLKIDIAPISSDTTDETADTTEDDVSPQVGITEEEILDDTEEFDDEAVKRIADKPSAK